MSVKIRRYLCKIPAIARRLESHYQNRPIKAVAITRDGIRMHLDTADFIQRTILLTGDWDDAVGEVLRARLKSGMTFVDVGANVGYFTLLASSLVGPHGKVIAFEPNPAIFAQLQNNIGLNGFTQVAAHKMGLCDKGGTGELFIADANYGAATLRPGGQNGVIIPLAKLDDIVGDKVDLLKIDIEGAEFAALRGADRLLSQSDAPIVICEISEFSLKAMGSSHYELYELMASYGFVPHIISQVRRSILIKDQVFFQYDVLFTKS